jgi:hypothetical protein
MDLRSRVCSMIGIERAVPPTLTSSHHPALKQPARTSARHNEPGPPRVAARERVLRRRKVRRRACDAFGRGRTRLHLRPEVRASRSPLHVLQLLPLRGWPVAPRRRVRRGEGGPSCGVHCVRLRLRQRRQRQGQPPHSPPSAHRRHRRRIPRQGPVAHPPPPV